MAKLLMWDIDGTLIRAHGSGRIAMNRAFEQLFGLKDVLRNVYLAGSLDVNTIHTVFGKYQIPLEELDNFLQAYYTELQSILPLRSELLCGVQEILLETNQSDNFCNALGTGNVETGARIKLEQFHLNTYFPVGGFSDRPMERFQMVEIGIQKAHDFYGVDFQHRDIVIIGDTIQDVEAANLCHARVISVATGGNRFEELERINPGKVLRDLSEGGRFFELLESW